MKFFLSIGISTDMVNLAGKKPIEVIEGDHEVKELLMDH